MQILVICLILILTINKSDSFKCYFCLICTEDHFHFCETDIGCYTVQKKTEKNYSTYPMLSRGCFGNALAIMQCQKSVQENVFDYCNECYSDRCNVPNFKPSTSNSYDLYLTVNAPTIDRNFIEKKMKNYKTKHKFDRGIPAKWIDIITTSATTDTAAFTDDLYEGGEIDDEDVDALDMPEDWDNKEFSKEVGEDTDTSMEEFTMSVANPEVIPTTRYENNEEKGNVSSKACPMKCLNSTTIPTTTTVFKSHKPTKSKYSKHGLHNNRQVNNRQVYKPTRHIYTKELVDSTNTTDLNQYVEPNHGVRDTNLLTTTDRLGHSLRDNEGFIGTGMIGESNADVRIGSWLVIFSSVSAHLLFLIKIWDVLDISKDISLE